MPYMKLIKQNPNGCVQKVIKHRTFMQWQGENYLRNLSE